MNLIPADLSPKLFVFDPNAIDNGMSVSCFSGDEDPTVYITIVNLGGGEIRSVICRESTPLKEIVALNEVVAIDLNLYQRLMSSRIS